MKNPAKTKGLSKAFTVQKQFGSGLLKLLLVIFILNGSRVIAQVGVHTDFPEASSAMDIYATDKGLLIPRVSLTSDLTDPSPVITPAVGLLVFNPGPDQPMGFYYWDEVHWVALGGGSASGDYWSLYGNAGTNVASNFIGTTDANDLAISTNSLERIRITAPGNIVIGNTAPYHSSDLFTVVGSTGFENAINAYSPHIGFYTESDHAGFFSSGGDYGLISLIDRDSTAAVFAFNANADGYAVKACGSGSAQHTLQSHSAGLASSGKDGIFSYAISSGGNGIIAVGSAGDTAYVFPEGAGGAFTGYHGSTSRARNTSGTGVIGSGNNGPATILAAGSGAAFTGNNTGIAGYGIQASSYGAYFNGYYGVYGKSFNSGQGAGVIGVGNNGSQAILPTGTGGAFSGYHGVYSKGTNGTGIGVIGIGCNFGSYNTITNGCGGSFSGYHGVLGVGTNAIGTGVVGAGSGSGYSYLSDVGSGGAFAGYHGSYSRAINAANGIGVIGVGSGGSNFATIQFGCGGSFIGYHGAYGVGGSNGGTGVIGAGNNGNYSLYNNGSGGAFTGIYAGAVGWGTDVSTGIGVIGSGNNATIVLPSPNVGCGGAFTGTTNGVYGYATGNANGTYGGYFSNGGGTSYAYVGTRFSNTNRKILGNGSVSTVVKNTLGELITLTCPEAPEIVFQDYGIGQLVNGSAHITIDPDLAININVSDSHPLKVYITPEGDCNGVYVTNKSAQGFDVIELRGGSSNVPFSWQIVATRANEENKLKDGSIEVSDNSQRFPPAPGPLEMIEQPAKSSSVIMNGNASVITEKSEVKDVESIDEESLKSINISVPVKIENTDE